MNRPSGWTMCCHTTPVELVCRRPGPNTTPASAPSTRPVPAALRHFPPGRRGFVRFPPFGTLKLPETFAVACRRPWPVCVLAWFLIPPAMGCAALPPPAPIPSAEELRALEEQLAQDPDDLDALLALGRGYVLTARASDARPLLERAVAVDGGNPDALLLLAAAHEELDELREAEERYRDYLALGRNAALRRNIIGRLELIRRRLLLAEARDALASEQGLTSFTSTPGTVTENGTAYCWGLNEFGQLGDGSQTDQPFPIAVDSGRQLFSEISPGGLHTCAVAADQSVSCWGYNRFGQLGSTSSDESLLVPTPISTTLQFASVSAGGLHSCGLTVDGQAMCWGYNRSGALGDGTGLDRSSPVSVLTHGLPLRSVSAGLHHTCAVTADGRPACWGYNRFGQVGDGSRTYRLEPQEVLQVQPFLVESASTEDALSERVAALLNGRVDP
ncbi:MAG: hypothetical protein GEU90_05670 [Gemmatimonas sp.]|nr:hypothetical protein [Gemmatimonas sp.]